MVPGVQESKKSSINIRCSHHRHQSNSFHAEAAAESAPQLLRAPGRVGTSLTSVEPVAAVESELELELELATFTVFMCFFLCSASVTCEDGPTIPVVVSLLQMCACGV